MDDEQTPEKASSFTDMVKGASKRFKPLAEDTHSLPKPTTATQTAVDFASKMMKSQQDWRTRKNNEKPSGNLPDM